MIKCLITQPNSDKVTSYLFHFGREILKESYPIKVQFINLEGDKVNKSNVESYLKKQDPKIVLFNGHGNDWTICGYKDEDLIMMNENEELLRDKIVYSLSCSSAAKLGKNAVLKGTKAFIGYSDSFMIYTDSEREATPLKDSIAASFLKPSNKLSISLLNGKSANESSKKSKEEFQKETKKYLTSKLFEGSERIAMALLWNMDNQIVLGDKEAKLE
jgi:hypothetical protein